ncbi:phosphotransferase [Paracerasibacillus soli]|uniref:Aminoglycoside phosphotransferase n=1 Tax=Paracerasibacillus soli TaxID=480284 RepID=A0ABU5CQ90_9BACI|nr:hypothetical protein [Virgibacillus soli]MDY0407984.1 hypothetical protein [Virgibacillus soli]
METWLKKIPLVLESENVKQIKKGYSSDIKYIIDEKFLIRIFKNESERRRREEFNTIKQLGNYSEYVPKAITYQMEEDFSYMVLSYFAGEDGRVR